jgi:hypothetical protein
MTRETSVTRIESSYRQCKLVAIASARVEGETRLLAVRAAAVWRVRCIHVAAEHDQRAQKHEQQKQFHVGLHSTKSLQ